MAPVDGALRKIARARQFADELLDLIHAFWASNPYRIEMVGTPLTGPGSYRIAEDPVPLPENVALITGDAFHNIRAALDHVAYAAVPQPHRGNVAFPVWRDPAKPSRKLWKGYVRGRLPGAPPRFVGKVQSLDAYREGAGEWIWLLHELDIIDKHKLVLAVASTATPVLDFGAAIRRDFPGSNAPSMKLAVSDGGWTPIEKGTKLFGVLDEKGFGSVPEFRFDVTLGEPDQLRGQPAVDSIRRFADNAERLVVELVALI